MCVGMMGSRGQRKPVGRGLQMPPLVARGQGRGCPSHRPTPRSCSPQPHCCDFPSGLWAPRLRPALSTLCPEWSVHKPSHHCHHVCESTLFPTPPSAPGAPAPTWLSHSASVACELTSGHSGILCNSFLQAAFPQLQAGVTCSRAGPCSQYYGKALHSQGCLLPLSPRRLRGQVLLFYLSSGSLARVSVTH